VTGLCSTHVCEGVTYLQILFPLMQVEPPQPEEKLAMLSDIAQEAGVEWDLSAAARELLPPGEWLGGGGQEGVGGGVMRALSCGARAANSLGRCET
jgi:hypothetical protein